jgi:predicted metal-dependent phosphoesterase TrpH
LFQILKKVYYKHYPNHNHKYISFENATKLIHFLNGQVILAHPYKYKRTNFIGKELVESALNDNLIDGIECFHPYHNQEETKTLLEYANKYDLYVTSGSDFHDLGRPIRNGICAKGLGYLDVTDKEISKALSEIKNNHR